MFQVSYFMSLLFNVMFTAADGSPGLIDGIPIWSVDNPDLVSLDVAEDGLTCLVQWKAPGVCQLTCAADVDLGDGVHMLQKTEMIRCLEQGATLITLNATQLAVSPVDEAPAPVDEAPAPVDEAPAPVDEGTSV